jgi:5-formyltetrahydrofolate cyclo-ligase
VVEPLPETKSDWRHWAKATRACLPLEPIQRHICAYISNNLAFQQAKHVLTYLAFDSELDLSQLQQDQSKTFYVTRTWGKRRGLSIHRLEPEQLETHPFGYRQPPANAAVIAPAVIDIALVPGLCFDRQGTRLGYGLGFYDRLLPELRPDVQRIGITAEALLVPKLPRESFDIPMTQLVTEAGLIPAHLDYL